ncbi:MAG: MAPEG family protein [Pseudomonadota bacterium]|nr:MAPEG family protein [Pseudomonadota bacterium]
MIAYLCLLVAALLPYVWIGIAKAGAPRYDNRDPRAWLDKQDSPRVRRATAAQHNAFEAFAPFAAGVLMAQFVGVDPVRINALALAFVGLRVLHGLLYVGNRHSLRSLVWLGALACVVALMVQAILRTA